MNKFVRDLFTEADNTTFDLGRVIGSLALLQYLFNGSWDIIIHGTKFDWQAAGIGLGALMGAYGLMIKLKGSEPASPSVTK